MLPNELYISLGKVKNTHVFLHVVQDTETKGEPGTINEYPYIMESTQIYNALISYKQIQNGDHTLIYNVIGSEAKCVVTTHKDFEQIRYNKKDISLSFSKLLTNIYLVEMFVIVCDREDGGYHYSIPNNLVVPYCENVPDENLVTDIIYTSTDKPIPYI